MTSAVFFFFNAPAVPISDKLILDSIRAAPEQYSHFRLGGSIGYCLGSLVIGFSIRCYGLLQIFPFFVTTMIACTMLIPPMPVSCSADNKLNLKHYREILHHKRFFFIYGTLAVWGLAEAALKFFALHLQKFGYNSQHIGLLLALAMAGEVVGFSLAAVLLKRSSPEKIILLSFAIQIIRSGSLALVFPLPAMAICQLIGGLSLPLIWASVTHLANSTFPPKMGNVAQGFKVIANNGIAQLFGVPLCGLIYQYLPSRFVFLFIVCIAVAYITVYLLVSAKPQRHKNG
jgi:PPP family 3-phenylpropionic acid transporter